MPNKPSITIQIGSALSPDHSLTRDIFTWSHEDMPGIDQSVMMYRFNIDPSVRPVKQKWRMFNGECYMAIHDEVDNLLKACFVREFTYPN